MKHLATFNLFRHPDKAIHVTLAEAGGVKAELGDSGAPLLPCAMNALRSAVELCAPEPTIENPTSWFYARHEESEWWHLGGGTRDEAIANAREECGPEAFYLVEARRAVPSLDRIRIFDGDEIVERMQDDEAWGEDGWEGAGDTAELERRLTTTLKRWFAECCDLTGAQLDFVTGPDRIEP